MDYSKIAKDALSQYLKIVIEIEDKWSGIVNGIDRVYLPDFREEFLIERLAGEIKQKVSKDISIYISPNEVYSAEMLIAKLEKCSSENDVPLKDLRVKTIDEGEDHIILEFKKSYTPIQIDILAKGMYEREVNMYKKDYETALRVGHSKKLA